MKTDDEVLALSRGVVEATVGASFGAAAGISMYQGMAIVAALAERGLVDMIRVAEWADTLAAMQAAGDAPGTPNVIAQGLRSFSAVLRAMAAPPIVATVEGTTTRQ